MPESSDAAELLRGSDLAALDAELNAAQFGDITEIPAPDDHDHDHDHDHEGHDHDHDEAAVEEVTTGETSAVTEALAPYEAADKDGEE